MRSSSHIQVLFVGNIDEGSVADGGNAYTRALKDYADSVGANNIVVCAKLEFDVCSFASSRYLISLLAISHVG